MKNLVEENIEKLEESGIKEFEILYTNEIDRGPLYFSNAWRLTQQRLSWKLKLKFIE